MPYRMLIFGLVLVSMGLFGGRWAHAEKPLIGYVNLQRAVIEVEEGKRAQASLQKKIDEKKKAIEPKEAELKALRDTLEKQSVVKKDDAATRKQRAEFQQKLIELQQTMMKEQQELQGIEQKELSAITAKMRKVIDQIGREGGYTLILESTDARLLFAKAHLDLTNEVIRKYNAKHK